MPEDHPTPSGMRRGIWLRTHVTASPGPPSAGKGAVGGQDLPGGGHDGCRPPCSGHDLRLERAARDAP